jgi:HD-like signal output (HDOD) protein
MTSIVDGSHLDLEAAVVDLISRDAVKIPPYPAVALRVAALIRTEDYGIDDVAKLVASDQALTATILHVASSAAYAGGEELSCVRSAVSCIGARETGALALAAGVGAQARRKGPLVHLRRQIWQAQRIALKPFALHGATLGLWTQLLHPS